MDDMTVWRMVERLKVELAGRGLSLRKVDALLPQGKRHKLQRKKGRPLPVEDILEILKVANIDPATFFGQVAGYGHPLEVAAIRGPKAPSWSQRQRRILAVLEDLPNRGCHGFDVAREELRNLELLRDEDPQAAETAAWDWLAREAQPPGAIVGLLSFLALAAPRSNAHHLLRIAADLVAGQLRSGAGGKLSTACGRCFVQVGLVEEGLSLLENFALPIVAIYGDHDDHAVVLFHIAQAAAKLGRYDLNRAALKKVAAIGSAHLRFSAAQLLAVQELNIGDVRQAARMYDDLVQDPQFAWEPKRCTVTVRCSRMTAHYLAGNLPAAATAEFGALVQEAKVVLSPKYYIAVVLDFVLFLETHGKIIEARRTLEPEIWTVLDLEDPGIQQKFAVRWEKLGLPRDTRFQTLADCLASGDNRTGRRGLAGNRDPQPPGS